MNINVDLVIEDAQNGVRIAQTLLGKMFYTGNHTIEKNHVESEKWLRLAAAQGCPEAKGLLGTLINQNKEHTLENVTESYKLWLDSAMGNNQMGQLFVGIMYQLGGDGVVEQNSAEAYKWFCLATDNGNARAAMLKKDMEESLSAEDLEKGRKLKEEFYRLKWEVV